MKLVSVLDKINNVLYSIQKVIILVGVIVMLVINGSQVFCRYVLRSSLAWSEQVSIMLYFILIMLGANLAVKSDSETKIDIIKFKDERKNIILHAITDIICIIVLAVFMYSSIALLQQAATFPQYLSSIHLNYFYIYIWLPVGFFLLLLDKTIGFIKRCLVISGKMPESILKPVEQLEGE